MVGSNENPWITFVHVCVYNAKKQDDQPYTHILVLTKKNVLLNKEKNTAGMDGA